MARELVLEAIRGVDGRAVLVGGQAVAFWAEHYAKLGRSLVGDPTGMYVSKDTDFATESLEPEQLRAVVADVASRLRGSARLEHEFGSLIVATVSFHDGAHHLRHVEFLRRVHGVSDRRRIFEQAVRLQAGGGLPPLRGMHPVMLLETRLANIVDLEKYQDDEGSVRGSSRATFCGSGCATSWTPGGGRRARTSSAR